MTPLPPVPPPTTPPPPVPPPATAPRAMCPPARATPAARRSAIAARALANSFVLVLGPISRRRNGAANAGGEQMTTDVASQTVDRYLSAFYSGDLAAARALVAD